MDHLNNKYSIIKIHHDLGASVTGASLAPVKVIDKLQAIQLGKSIAVCDVFQPETSAKTNHINAKHIDHIIECCKNILPVVNNVVSEGRFPLIISGDHSTAMATMAALKQSHKVQRLGVIWLDAHADAHSPYTTPSGNLHGMPLTAICHQDNQEFQINNVPAATMMQWAQLKLMLGTPPSLNFNDVVFIGIRDTEAAEDALLSQYQCLNFSPTDITKIGIAEVVAKSLARLQQCDAIYLSLDIDCLDSEFVPGTGTPVGNGLEPDLLMDMVNQFALSKKLIGFEVAEVNPLLDLNDKTSTIAAKIIDNFIVTRESTES